MPTAFYRISFIFLFVFILLQNNQAQSNFSVDFSTKLKKNDRLVYRVAETKFRQNMQGVYSFLLYDTTFMLFHVRDENDSMLFIDLNYADYFKNNAIETDEINKNDLLKTETYQMAFTKKGQFIELINWESFASLLIQNLKNDYLTQKIDSLTLKYYFLEYHKQRYVENLLIPRAIELFEFNGEILNNVDTFKITKILKNPFGGNDLLKTNDIKFYTDSKFKNSIFSKLKITSNSVDNVQLQKDQFIFEYKVVPTAELLKDRPFVYIVDTYEYQLGLVNNIVMTYESSHVVYSGEEKQGIYRSIVIFAK